MIFFLIGATASQCEFPQLVQLISHPPFLDPFPAKFNPQPEFTDIATPTYYLKDFRSYQIYTSGEIRVVDKSVSMQGGKLSLSLNFTLKKSKLTSQQIQFSTDVSFKAYLQTAGSIFFGSNLTLNSSLVKFTNLAKLTQKDQKDMVDRILAQVNTNNQQLSLILNSYLQLFKAPLKSSYVYQLQGYSAGINMDVLQANLTDSNFIIGYKGQIGTNECNPWMLPSGSYLSGQFISVNFIETLISQFFKQGYKETALFERQTSKIGVYDFSIFKTGYVIPAIYDSFGSAINHLVQVNCKLINTTLQLQQQNSLTTHYCFVQEYNSSIDISNFYINSTQKIEVSQLNDMATVKLVDLEIKGIQFDKNVVQTQLGQFWISQISRLSLGESLVGQGLKLTPRSCSQLKWEQDAAIFYEC